MHATRILRATTSGKPNITGFDVRKFGKAAHTTRYDPWERNEAWRYTGHFSRFNRFKNALPGLGTASVAFAGYCLYEYLFIKDEHHAEAHGGGHH
ncbi:NADH-ubiquinone oxidoreductase B12 subunit family-domain-containing protein [Cercophora newfieldiana]|uniref:NADH-ubiquinone oxidoreductase B12 subunit family-domain-containing protein n=1 Tax=Cercophora newfieldiana TaxID=92897 RepID=A0AA39Y5A2_9PEZI|nr:NADH-ubiquinone oxidoreductase B12 subunit family-domain-containing protein [Cercophora newfieldiana]